MKKSIKALLSLLAIVSSMYLPSAQASVITAGSASILNDGSIRLTNAGWQAGAAWFNTPISTSDSFSASFDFALTNLVSGLMGDGFTFALQNKGTNVVGSNGGNIGYGGINAVGAVFQTFSNNHVGIDTTGNPYNAASTPGVNLGASKLITGTELVSYNVISKLLTMTSTFNANGIIYSITDSKTIDLASIFGSTIYAGFTAGTGSNFSSEVISNYALNVVPEPASIALLLVGLIGMGFVARRKSAQ